jgi:hypothetical protein
VKKGSVIVAFVLIALLGAGVVGAGATASAPAKKRCHFVKKKVHGKIKRVRVCTKPKPKPKPKPAPTAKNVEISLDAGRGAEASIGSSGGTVSAESASGAKATLSIPAGALAEPTAVSLTPVASLRGISKISLLAAVELGPDGTALAAPATLSLELPSTPSRVFGIAWYGAGHNVHRYPIVRSGSRVTIRLTHFSGAGVATGDQSLLPQLETALTVSYAREVRPLMRQAETNDALFSQAFEAAFTWLRAVELVTLQDRFKTWIAEAQRSLRTMFATALAKASERCTQHDLTQLAWLAKLDQKAQSLGLDLSGPTGAERIERCARFRLEFETTATGTGNEATWSNHVRAAVPIVLAEVGYHGEGPLESLSLTATGCSTTEVTVDGPFVVDRLNMQLPTPNAPADLSVLIRPPIVHATGMCGPVPITLPGYWHVFVYFHRSEYADGFFRIGGWTWVGGEVVATKHYDSHEAELSEQTTLVLRHTPVP